MRENMGFNVSQLGDSSRQLDPRTNPQACFHPQFTLQAVPPTVRPSMRSVG
jgi:hypothetical protein